MERRYPLAAVDLGQLAAELAALPACAPTPGPDGQPRTAVAVLGDPAGVALVLPDDLDAAALAAVAAAVAAHRPQPRSVPATLDDRIAAAIAAAVAAVVPLVAATPPAPEQLAAAAAAGHAAALDSLTPATPEG